MTKLYKHIRRLDVPRDARVLHAVFGDEQSCRYLSGPHKESVEETLDMLAKWTVGTEETSWAIIEMQDGPTLGRVSLIPHEDDVWEAAVMLIPEANGKGLASKAMAEALGILFEKHNARRVFADCDPDNVASIKLFERLGFTREGHLRAAWSTHIGIRDSVILGLINTDAKVWV